MRSPTLSRARLQQFLELELAALRETLEQLKLTNSHLRRREDEQRSRENELQEENARLKADLQALRAMGIVGNTHNDEGAGHG